MTKQKTKLSVEEVRGYTAIIIGWCAMVGVVSWFVCHITS